MSKIALHFSMDTSYGGSWELVMNTDRQWFCREYGWNGYGRGWSKWKSTEPHAVTFGIRTLTMYDGSVQRDRVAIVENGFNSDKTCILSRNLKRIEKPKYRLPK